MDGTDLPPFYGMNNTAVTDWAMVNNTAGTDKTIVNISTSAINVDDFVRIKAIFDVAMFINRYYLWPLFVPGFAGNVAAIITIFRMRSIGTFPVFVVLLAVMDSLAILVKLIFYQLLDHKVDMGNAGCSLLKFLGSWASAYSSWVLVCMALERFMAIRFPLKITMLNGRNSKVVATLGLVGCVVAGVYLPQLWTNQIKRTGSTLQCQYKPDYEAFMNSHYFWLAVSVYAFLPFCLLTAFNCLIICQIRRSLQPRKTLRTIPLVPHAYHGCSAVSTYRQRPDRNIQAIQSQVNWMLLSAALVSVILTFPICIFVLADYHWKVEPGYTHSNAVKFLCQQLAFVLADSTHAVNFYLYFLSARRFRHHFLVTFKVCYCGIKSLCRQAKGSNQSELEEL